MAIPKHVIIDLLPLYLAGEVSEATRSLIQEYMNSDPQLRELVQRASETTLATDIPLPQHKEKEMEAFKKVKHLMFQHNLFLVAAVICTFLTGMATLFLMDETPFAPFVLFALALFFWAAFFVANRKLSA